MPSTPYAKEIMIVEGSSLPGTFQPYQDVFKIKTALLPGATGMKDFSAYKYYAMGDSRTAGSSSNVADAEEPTGYLYPKAYPDVEGYGWNYPSDIEYNTGITLFNVGQSGLAWARRVGSPELPIMYDFIMGNVGLSINAMPSDIDIITIHAGTK